MFSLLVLLSRIGPIQVFDVAQGRRLLVLVATIDQTANVHAPRHVHQLYRKRPRKMTKHVLLLLGNDDYRDNGTSLGVCGTKMAFNLVQKIFLKSLKESGGEF